MPNILNLITRGRITEDFQFFLLFFPLAPSLVSFVTLSIVKKRKRGTNLNECARPRINSANNHRGRQGRKRNDRGAAEERRRKKDEWKEREPG